jgi:anthranilate synthase component 2
MILLVDNYDSFTYNLVQSMAGAGAEVEVVRNDELSAEEALARQPRAIILSPGPGRPDGAGICLELLAALPEELPLLGVCLGHQALVQSLGGALEVDPVPTHGKESDIHWEPGTALFEGVPNPFPAGRYHSLRAERESLPEALKLTAWTEDGLVMAVEHRTLPRIGLQFHPESILSPQGDLILRRFLERAGELPRKG